MPLGEPWRVGKRPYGLAALSIMAACLKSFYLHQASAGVNVELGKSLDRHRLPTRADRRRSFLGHVITAMPANPLAPQGPRRRHPKMLPDGTHEMLLATVQSARDRMTITWLADGACGSVSCAGCTWSTCTCARMRRAGSAGARTTCAIDPTIPTMPRPKRNTRGGLKTGS